MAKIYHNSLIFEARSPNFCIQHFREVPKNKFSTLGKWQERFCMKVYIIEVAPNVNLI